MANRHRGEVTLKLDRERVLKFDANALASFECEYGKPAAAVMIDSLLRLAGAGRNPLRMGTALGFREVRALLWASLLHKDEDLTIRQAGSLIDQAPGGSLMEKLAHVTGPVMEAFQATMPEVSKKNMDEALEQMPPEIQEILKAVSSPTGENSNGSPAASAV